MFGKYFQLWLFPFDYLLDLVITLVEFCQNFEEETSRLEPNLDPVNSPVNDEVAMNVFRLESRVAAVVDYLARLKAATSRIDSTLWPEETLQNDLESLMARLNTIPGRVQEWKKSSARCGADVALCLARGHCKDAREEKLAALRVANTKKHDFDPSWRPSSLLPLGSQMESTWTSSLCLPALLRRGKKLLCLML